MKLEFAESAEKSMPNTMRISILYAELRFPGNHGAGENGIRGNEHENENAK